MNMFDDINEAWRGKRVVFISGRHEGKTGTCDGFYNAYGGAGLRITCDNSDVVMVYSRDLDSIKIQQEK